MIRVMVIILEKVNNFVNVIMLCRVCFEELYVLLVDKKNFNIVLEKGLKFWFGKGDCKVIVVVVCDINYVIFDIFFMVGFDSFIWLIIDVGVENVYFLRDVRVVEFY